MQVSAQEYPGVNPLRILADSNMRGVEAYFAPLGSVQLAEGRQIKNSDLRNVDALLVRSVTNVNQSLLENTAVKFVGTATSGFDHIDRGYLTDHNIGFSHAPGANANSVVEYVFAAISAVEGKLESLLSGGTLGVIGYGNVGRALVRLCNGLGISVKVHDPWLEETSVPSRASLGEILGCEVIAIHPSLTREKPWPSYHLIGKAELESISRDALLINASRGEVVDNTALLNRLRSGEGPLCVLDVWEGEPEISIELLQLAEFGTAHIAGYSMNSKFLATKMLRDAINTHFKLDELKRASQAASQLETQLEVPPNLKSVDLLRWAFSVRYDIRKDDQLLRNTVLDPNTIVADGFDRLRNSYRSRFEMRDSIVHLHPQAVQDQSHLLMSLGCQIGRVGA